MPTHIQIRYIGKPQEPWIKTGIQMYATRCQSMAKIEALELPEAHKGSAKPNIQKTIDLESESLSKNLPAAGYVIALDQTGQNITSEDLAAIINKETEQGKTIIFQIGGSWGMNSQALKKADRIISFGKITLPHSLARLLLMEQIYRAHTIINGRQYHK